MKTSPIILALDTDSLDTAENWVKATQRYVGTYKVGLEFFLNFGRAGIERISEISDRDIFLDLKLHDIPNTVAGAVRAIADLEPRFLTVHATGGKEMVSAAVAQAGSIEITAVTILTSLSQADVTQIGFNGTIDGLASALARQSADAGARAIVCSPFEIESIREAVGPDVSIITPGVRLTSGGDDQKRTKTPAQALSDGADFLVIGRPITGAWKDGAAAMEEAARVIASSLGA